MLHYTWQSGPRTQSVWYLCVFSLCMTAVRPSSEAFVVVSLSFLIFAALWWGNQRSSKKVRRDCLVSTHRGKPQTSFKTLIHCDLLFITCSSSSVSNCIVLNFNCVVLNLPAFVPLCVSFMSNQKRMTSATRTACTLVRFQTPILHQWGNASTQNARVCLKLPWTLTSARIRGPVSLRLVFSPLHSGFQAQHASVSPQVSQHRPASLPHPLSHQLLQHFHQSLRRGGALPAPPTGHAPPHRPLRYC